MKTIAITGATGHIGNQIVRTLLDQGYGVKALVRNTADHALANLPVTFVQGDLQQPAALDALCKNTNVVFHLAAKVSLQAADMAEMHSINVSGTESIIRACLRQKVRRLIYFSSISALEATPLDLPLNETRPFLRQGSAYGLSKAAAERVVLQAQDKGLESIILSPTGVVGPGDYKPSMLGRALMGFHSQRISWLIPGGYDWIDVRDIARTAVNSIERGRSGERYLLAGEWLSFADLCTVVGDVIKRPIKKIVIPTNVLKGLLSVATPVSAWFGKALPITRESLDIIANNHRQITAQKAIDELGHHARPLDETLTDTYQWFKERGYIS